MKLIRGLHNLKPFNDGCVATIGNYDGVHMGHQGIIDQLKLVAKSMQLPAVVMIFEPQPREFFNAGQAPPRLTRFTEKLLILQKLHVDSVVCLQFNQRLRSLTGQAFVEQVLVQGLAVRHLVVGDDFRFGCDRSGDFALLQSSGQQFGFGVEQSSTLEIEGERVSSTRIRSLLIAGEFAAAERLLGRPYCMTGRVIFGKQLGRQLGIPTANIHPGSRKPVLSGVFAVLTTLEDGLNLPGVANVGIRPSVEDATVKPVLEVHLPGFKGDLYGQRVVVRFLKKIRDERKFDSLDALKQQINADIHSAGQYFHDSEININSIHIKN